MFKKSSPSLSCLQLFLPDSRRQLEQWQNGSDSEKNLNLAIPLLMQNKVPEGFEDGDLINVGLRPESVSVFHDLLCVFHKEIINSLTAFPSCE